MFAELTKLAAQALLQAAVAVGIFFLGIRYERLRREKQEEKKLDNIRAILFKELVENYRILIRWAPKEEKGIALETREVASLAVAFTLLSSSVYDKYLDHLCELKVEEVHSIYSTYLVIKPSVRMGGEYRAMTKEVLDQPIQNILEADSHLTGKYIETLKAIAKSLVLFEGGKEILEILDAQRGKGRERMSKQ